MVKHTQKNCRLLPTGDNTVVNMTSILQNSIGSKMMSLINPAQVSTDEKQGRAIIALLITKFRGYRCVKSHMPPAK